MPETPEEPEARGTGTRLFQIYAHDLATLEADCAALCDSLMAHLTPADKTRARRVKRVLSDVRWNYGPPQYVETFPADGPVPECDDE